MRFPIPVIFLLIACSITAQLSAQSSPRKMHRDSVMTRRNTQDTNYVRKYPNRLIITLTQSVRQYDVRFTQTLLPDTSVISAPKMLADANVATGLSVDFDKISFSFGIKSAPSTTENIRSKGKTTYKSFNLSLGAYRFRFEGSFRHYHGFYDQNSYDSINKLYYQDPTMDVRSLRLKTMYIFNKKRFSYNSAYYNTYRQVKPAGSWLLVSNLYNYRFASDSALLTPLSRPFYGQWGNLNGFNITGLSVGPGASYNLVLFKVLYLNLTLTSGLDMMRMSLAADRDGRTATIWKTGYAGDFRSALGFNSRNFFMSLTYRQDYNSYRTNGFRVEPRFHSIDFNMGYRFPFKERSWVKKLKQNKWYQLL